MYSDSERSKASRESRGLAVVKSIYKSVTGCKGQNCPVPGCNKEAYYGVNITWKKFRLVGFLFRLLAKSIKRRGDVACCCFCGAHFLQTVALVSVSDVLIPVILPMTVSKADPVKKILGYSVASQIISMTKFASAYPEDLLFHQGVRQAIDTSEWALTLRKQVSKAATKAVLFTLREAVSLASNPIRYYNTTMDMATQLVLYYSSRVEGVVEYVNDTLDALNDLKNLIIIVQIEWLYPDLSLEDQQKKAAMLGISISPDDWARISEWHNTRLRFVTSGGEAQEWSPWGGQELSTLGWGDYYTT